MVAWQAGSGNETSNRWQGEGTAFHLPEELIDDLEDAWLQLRKEAKPGKKKLVSKSGIVRLAIELAIEDIKAEGTKGTKSRLARKLLS